MEGEVALLRSGNQQLKEQMTQMVEMVGSIKEMFVETISQVKDLIKECRCKCQNVSYSDAARSTSSHFPALTRQMVALQSLKEFQSAQDQKKTRQWS